MFTLGIILGAAVYAVVYRVARGQRMSPVAAVARWRLVGVGTRIGKGCTSGHGVCGVGSASRTSLAGVLAFLLVAILTAQVVAALGVTP